MKVIHVPYSFPPDPPGGTEIYVASLGRVLQDAGVETLVCAPGPMPATYIYEGLRVRRYAGGGLVDDASSAYDEGDPVGAAEFDRILEEERPDVVHLHSFTAMASVRVARRVRERGIPLVFTYHVPTVSCQRGAMLLWGSMPCDGELRVDRCAACSMHGMGVPLPLARALGGIPPAVGKRLQQARRTGGAWTALRMTHLIETRHAAIRAFLGLAERIVAPSEWVKGVLAANGVAPSRIVVCAQGLPYVDVPDAATKPARRGASLALAFFGRLDRTKGLDVVLDALARIPDAPVQLDLYGVVARVNDPYCREIGRRVMLDPRVRLLPPVPSGRSVALMRGYDALLVPSQWLETGPLVVLEAFAAGIPVIGSNMGGIADRVRDGVDGILVEAGDPRRWAQAIGTLARDRDLLSRLVAGVRAPRSMGDVGTAMTNLYRELLLAPDTRPAQGSTDRSRRVATG